MSMLADEVDVVIGIDTHKYTHTAAVLSASTAGVLAKMTVGSGGLPDTRSYTGWASATAIKQARTQFQSLVVTGPEPLQGRLGKLKGLALLRAGALADQDGDGPELRLMAGALRALARRALSLYQEAKSYQASMRTIVEAWHPELPAQTGVGTIVAATVLCAWSHPGRFRSEASFAMLAGSAPLDASSGLSTHHRLSRCGDRQLNRACT